jgi:hypothetical protein
MGRPAYDGHASPNEHHLAEIKRINDRRGESGGVRWINSSGESGDALVPHIPGVIFDHSGLAFSGGGIRSAAFCLGAVQALDADGKLAAIDYLSTVSGGGYIGCSLAASMGATGVFPFAAKSDAGAANPGAINDLQDSVAVQHIRDYSNYLMPRGFDDLTLSIGVLLRGLTASASLVVGPILLLASLALWLHPTREDLLVHDAFGIPISGIPYGHLILAAVTAVSLAAFLLVWGLGRSLEERAGGAPYEFTSKWPGTARWLLGALIAVLFVEVQPIAILSLESENAATGVLRFPVSSIGKIAQFLAPIAGVITFFAGRLADIIKAKSADLTGTGRAIKLASQALLLFAAIIVPLLLWTLWLHLVYWGTVPYAGISVFNYLPQWLGPPLVYFVIGALLFLLSLTMEPNANSLHRLYRDRLADAFLFLTERGQRLASGRFGGPVGSRRTRLAGTASAEDEVKPLDRVKLSELDTDHAPYLIINAAVNIQGSAYVNRRGRNADFFIFSRDYVGSHATGLVPTEAMEKRHPALDLGTAMAISGAAVSANMGAHSIRMLAPTLVLLNVRLGYWLPNPAWMAEVVQRYSKEPIGANSWSARVPSSLYLVAEMFSLLNEGSRQVYLTDGGHIENLGTYELLKRRCRLIVIVDAECDPSYTFSSFVTLQRYARIDLGIRIDNLSWSVIRARSLEYGRDLVAAATTGVAPKSTTGCHAAAAIIDYPDAPPGILLYLKSSITGDENDLIISYKNHYSDFPHETTGDQFFGEAQFEAYRALGFHAVRHLLTGEDHVPGLIPSESDGSRLQGQDEADARALRKAKIDKIFGDRLSTGTILNA